MSSKWRFYVHIKCSVTRYASLNMPAKSANDKKVYRSKVYRSEFTQLLLGSPGMKGSVCACVGVRVRAPMLAVQAVLFVHEAQLVSLSSGN